MNATPVQKEAETKRQRVELFTSRGLGDDTAKSLANLLLVRDRDMDGRGVCAECVFMEGHTMELWKCTAPRHVNNLGGLKLEAFEMYQRLHRCSTRVELL